jgi:hypothetical protein
MSCVVILGDSAVPLKWGWYLDSTQMLMCSSLMNVNLLDLVVANARVSGLRPVYNSLGHGLTAYHSVKLVLEPVSYPHHKYSVHASHGLTWPSFGTAMYIYGTAMEGADVLCRPLPTDLI